MAEGDEISTPRRARDRPGVDSVHDPDALSLGGHVLAFFRELGAVVIGAVIVAALLRGLVGQMFIIPSISMENTLREQDRVLVEKLSSIDRGEVVVFADPGDWLNGTPTLERGPVGRALEFVGVLPDTTTEHLIKRVVGMPGDRVVCCDARGRISVNNRALDETGYLFPENGSPATSASTIPFDVVVPDGHFFVLGDNRRHSRDSRCHLNDVQDGLPVGQNAFVAEDLVVGRAIAVVWPWSRQHRLAVPATFGSVPTGAVPAPGTPEFTVRPQGSC